MSDASSVGLDILVPSRGLHVNMLHCRERVLAWAGMLVLKDLINQTDVF